MTSSALDQGEPVVHGVRVTDSTLLVAFRDGRMIAVPLNWFPRLAHGTRSERNAWKLIGGGSGIHWEALDEDISAEGLLAGRRSGESAVSFKKWLANRPRRPGDRSRVSSGARRPAARSRPGRRSRLSMQKSGR